MKKIVLLIATAMFLVTGVTYAQVNTKEKDILINPSKKLTASKKYDAANSRRDHLAKRKAQPKTNVNANNPNAPVIKFNELEHDYGTFKQGGDGAFDFVFKNEGKEPLILSNVRSSCGCTIPTWPKQPIMPGQSEKIHVVYDTKRVGAFHKSIHIYSNAKQSTVTLKIKGLIERDPNAPVKKKEKKKTTVKHTEPYKYNKKEHK